MSSGVTAIVGESSMTPSSPTPLHVPSAPFLTRFALPARKGMQPDTIKTDVLRETTDDQ